MSQEYIEEIKVKGTDLGVLQLDDSGMSISMDSFITGCQFQSPDYRKMITANELNLNDAR